MQSKIVLVSDDSDFFDYIVPKLKLRKSDELFRFSFADLPDKVHLLTSSLLVINSEANMEQTLQLLDLIDDVPSIIFGYNNDDEFIINAYNKGALSFITLDADDDEIDAKLMPALKLVTLGEKTALYREMLVNNNLITKNNDVFLDFKNILECEVSNINKNSAVATLVAIAPDDKSKYVIQPNQLETVILNNVRKNDILMSYSFNKYFLLLKNTNKDKAQKLWDKIKKKLPEGICAGFASVGNNSRQHIVNEALNSLHRQMTMETSFISTNNTDNSNNFKNYRKELNKKIMQIIYPVFYHIQQKYNDKLFGIKIEQIVQEEFGIICLLSKTYSAEFKVTCPGAIAVNIDISYNKLIDNCPQLNLENKRITLVPNEFEAGLLQDLIVEFIQEFKQTVDENIYQEEV